MFIRRTKYKNSTYYYLARRIPGTDRDEVLAKIGCLESPSLHKESELVKKWAVGLATGTERAIQKFGEGEKRIELARVSEYGKTFDLDQCLNEFRMVYEKYGKLTKTLLEETARPNGEISWGTTTILKQLRKRGLSLKQVFDQVVKLKGLGPETPILPNTWNTKGCVSD